MVARNGGGDQRDACRHLSTLLLGPAGGCAEDGEPVDRTFGLSWWRSLAALEGWAKEHPTHLAIFGAAMRYLSTLGPAARLRLYHEVSVATADEQYFEYVDCADGSGVFSQG